MKHPPRRYASPPSRGAHPVARQSRIHGCPGTAAGYAAFGLLALHAG